MTKNTTTQMASARPRRVPISSRNRLSLRNREPGYHYRIVNVNLERDPDRIDRFLEQGYEIVPKSVTGQIGDKRVDNPTSPGSASEISVGGGVKAVVMRIKEEYYKEDQAAKQAQIDELEQTMKRPSTNLDYGNVGLK